MPETHREVERTFTPSQGAGLPDLTELEAVRAVERVGVTELDATYFDVPGLVLLRAGVTLRHRSGGDDDGWHLKLPVDRPDARAELHVPSSPGQPRPPATLVRLVEGWTRGIAMAPVGRMETTRTTWELTAGDGRTLAELVDDRVLGRPAQLAAEPTRWREWEIELVEGDPGLLDDVEELFSAAGIERSEVQQKLARLLGAPSVDGGPGPATKKGPAREHLHRWMVEQVHEIETLDPVTRRGGHGGVHGLRKACRRLRAALATYRPLVDREQTDPLREELRWLARSLGPARDGEVVLERLVERLDREPPEPGVDTARRLLERHAAAEAVAQQAHVDSVLGSRRYFDLRTALDRLVAEPPWTDLAEERARDVLPDLVHREGKRVRRRYRRGGDPHEVRKAAKRLRYAYELVEPAWGKKARRPRRAAQSLSRILGERQDLLVAREWLVALASEALRTGDSSFTLGRLHALEEQREVVVLEDALEAWRELEPVRW